MKNIIHYIHLHPKRARGILGISYDQFISLMEQALLAHQEQKAQLEKGKLRVNSPGGGRKPKLTIEEEICLTLFYLRQMPTGKKKYHSFKNQVVSMPKAKDIVDVIVGKPGPTSDISLFRDQQEKFDSQQKFQGDKAYIGGDNMTTPKKKPRNKELTDEQKEANKKLSSKRIFVEHIIRIMKK